MSNQENNQEQIQFPAQQELKHLRTRCGKVYALGNNRFRAVVQTTPCLLYTSFVNHLLLTFAMRMPQLTDDVRSVARRGCLDESENRAGKEKFFHG